MFDEKFLYIAAALLAWGAYSYIRDVLGSDTRPNLVTWFLWTLAPMIAFAAQIRSGVGSVALFTLMVGLCPLAVLIAGLKKGNFRPSKFDLVCGSMSMLALGLWQLTGSGLVAVALSIVADGLAAAPTAIKSYRDPRSESPFLFLLFAVSAFIALLTTDTWTLESSGFSLYILALYLLLYSLVRFEPGLRRQPNKLIMESTPEEL